MPDGSSRFSIAGELIYHYMGMFRKLHGRARNRVGKIRSDAFDKVCYIGRCDRRAWCGDEHCQGRAGQA